MKRAIGAIVLMTGACTAPPTIMGSDIPQVPGLTSVQSIGVVRDGATIHQGTFVSRGSVADALQHTQAIVGTASEQGWQVRGPDGSRFDATLHLAKGHRLVRYELRADRVDPDMGQAIVTVSTAEVR